MILKVENLYPLLLRKYQDWFQILVKKMKIKMKKLH